MPRRRRPLRFALALAAALGGAAVAACGEPDSPRPAVPGDAERGRALLAQFQCGRCHVIPGVAGARGQVAVTLESFASRSYIAGRLPHEPETLVAWIVDPPRLVPDTLMPAMGVGEAQARDMAAYLGTLR